MLMNCVLLASTQKIFCGKLDSSHMVVVHHQSINVISQIFGSESVVGNDDVAIWFQACVLLATPRVSGDVS